MGIKNFPLKVSAICSIIALLLTGVGATPL